MRGPDLTQWIQQLAHFAPSLLVYMIAFVLAIMYWKRARTPAMLTLIAVVLSVTTSIGFSVMQTMLIQSAQENDGFGGDFGKMMSALGMTSSCAHAVALALFVAAIFVGRNQFPREPE